ncbi:hypothetical protein [Streptomyces alanosinicus]|nr:hypothetical protein [Streptomyces alanosinicus]
MTCDKRLDVPEGMRKAALDFPSELPFEGDDPLPEDVTCELDKHPFGDHVALLRDLGNEFIVWVTWKADGLDADADDIKVQQRAVCKSESPSPDGEDLRCWLPEAHRGGHAWERYL